MAECALAHLDHAHLDHARHTGPDTGPDIKAMGDVDESTMSELRHAWKNRIKSIDAQAADGTERGDTADVRQLRHRLLAVESAELDRLHRDGAVSDTTRRRIQHRLDVEQAGPADDL